MSSIEGNRGEPRPRPPFPAVKGLFAKPSNINNVETYANVPQIIINGAEWYASMGTEKSKGTKTFALAGDVKHTGLIEVLLFSVNPCYDLQPSYENVEQVWDLESYEKELTNMEQMQGHMMSQGTIQ